MKSLPLLFLGLLCIGSGICGKDAKMTANQQPGIHHLSGGPGKTFIRILPHGVEMSHDKHLAVHFISSLPTKKCKKSTTQNQYQQLRFYLRRNLKQLGKGIIVLTNLTKTQSQDVAALAAAINSSEDGQCEEEINTKGISQLIQALMLAVQNDNSYQPPGKQPKTLPKAFKNGRVVLPLNRGLHSRLDRGLPQGYKRMAFSHGGVPGATFADRTKGKPITSFEKKPTTYYEFPTMSDGTWTLIDPVEKNKTHPMLFIMGQKPEKHKTNKKQYKYYDLPLTEEKAKKNTDGNFRLLNKRWKIPSQLNASDHCDTDSQDEKCYIKKSISPTESKRSQGKPTDDISEEIYKKIKPEDFDSLEVDEFWSEEPRNKRNRRPKYGKGHHRKEFSNSTEDVKPLAQATDEKPLHNTTKPIKQDAMDTSAESQQRRYLYITQDKTLSNKPKRKRKRRPKYGKHSVKSDFTHDAKEFEKPKQNETLQALVGMPSSDKTNDEQESKETSVESQRDADSTEADTASSARKDTKKRRRKHGRKDKSKKPKVSPKEKLEVSSEVDHGSKDKIPTTLEPSDQGSSDQPNNGNKLVDEEDLDNDYGENDRPSKVPRYDDMMKVMPTGKVDYGALSGEEVVDHGGEAFDMDIEIDPWIF